MTGFGKGCPESKYHMNMNKLPYFINFLVHMVLIGLLSELDAVPARSGQIFNHIVMKSGHSSLSHIYLEHALKHENQNLIRPEIR